MTSPKYRVYLGLEPVDLVPKEEITASAGRYECAILPGRQEAEDFIRELLQNHCACATGEAGLLADMTVPELFTAGD